MALAAPLAHAPARRRRRRGPELVLAAISALAAGGAMAAAATLAPPLVLPALSVMLILAACVTAVIAWRTKGPSRPDHLTYWDVTGLLTFVGICAALLSEPEYVLPLLEAQRK